MKKPVLRVTSLLLVFLLTFQLLPLNTLAAEMRHATEQGIVAEAYTNLPDTNEFNADDSAGDESDDALTDDLPLSTPEEDSSAAEYLDILYSHESIDTLSEDDLAVLCAYTGAEADDFAYLASLNFALLDAVQCILLAEAYAYPVAEVALSFDYATSIIQIEEVSKFDCFVRPGTLDVQTESMLCRLLFEGCTFDEVIKIYGISLAFAAPLSPDVLSRADSDGDNAAHSEDIPSDICSLSAEYGISATLLMSAYGMDGSLEALENQCLEAEQVSSSLFVTIADDNEDAASDADIESTSDSSSDAIYVTQPYFNAPYAYAYSDNESVSLSSGALSYEVEDLFLPGVDGMDLTITRRYCNQAATEHVPAYYENRILDGTAYTVDVITFCYIIDNPDRPVHVSGLDFHKGHFTLPALRMNAPHIGTISNTQNQTTSTLTAIDSPDL